VHCAALHAPYVLTFFFPQENPHEEGTNRKRWQLASWRAAGLILALGSSAVGQGGEGDVKKIAELVKKGDYGRRQKKAAEAYAKGNEIEDIMNLFQNPPTKRA